MIYIIYCDSKGVSITDHAFVTFEYNRYQGQAFANPAPGFGSRLESWAHQELAKCIECVGVAVAKDVATEPSAGAANLP